MGAREEAAAPPPQPAVMIDPSWGRKGSQEVAPAQGSSGSLGTIAGKKKSERRKSIGQEVVIATPSGPKVVRRVSDDSEDDEDDEEKAAALATLAEAQEVAAEAEAALEEQDEEYGGALHV